MLLTITTTHQPASDLGFLLHKHPDRCQSFELSVVLTTPNREFNVKWETLGAGRFRHPDHRFEWTRQEFQDWAKGVAGRFSYAVRFVAVGPEDEKLGPPTQMGIFTQGGSSNA